MIIAVDFDGTVVEHKYPEVGHDVPGAVKVLRKLVDQGHQIILWTMRSDESLQAAVDWYKQKGIPLYGINTNPQQKEWTTSPKAYAQLYIDDAALGCPLDQYEEMQPNGNFKRVGRPFVMWSVVEQWLYNQNILKREPGKQQPI